MSGPAPMFGTIVRFVLPPAILAVGIGGFVVLANSREQPVPRDVETPPPLVETVPVSEAAGGIDLDADGVVVPFRSIVLSAEVDGRVVEKSDDLRAGRTVKKGQVLLKIDPANYELQVARLEREKEQASASLEELEVQIRNTESSIALAKESVSINQAEYQRVQGLERRGVSTQQALDTARSAELASRTTLVGLENERRLFSAQRNRLEHAVKLAESQLDQAKLDLARTELRAPADGVIVEMLAEQDSYLRKGDKIAEFEDTSAVEVRTNLEMRALAWMRANMPIEAQQHLGPYELPKVPVTVTYEVWGNTYSWSGVLNRFDGSGVDERTRTVPCRVLIRDPRSVSLKSGSPDLPVAAPPALMRGMYVRIQLHTKPNEPLLSVPDQAVRPGNMVWAVRDGKLKSFELPAARVTRGAVLVPPQVTDLRVDDQIVVSPLPAAQEGMAVRVQGADGVDETSRPLTAERRAADEGDARR